MTGDNLLNDPTVYISMPDPDFLNDWLVTLDGDFGLADLNRLMHAVQERLQRLQPDEREGLRMHRRTMLESGEAPGGIEAGQRWEDPDGWAEVVYVTNRGQAVMQRRRGNSFLLHFDVLANRRYGWRRVF